MFWKKDKSIRVELITPITLVTAPPAGTQSPVVSEQATSVKKIETNVDLAFKLINYAALGLQAALVVYGYSLLVGYYNSFGIDTNEIALSTPSLLLFGYISLFSGALEAANYVPIIGPGILAFCFILVAGAFIWAVVKNAKRDTKMVLACWVGFLLFIAFFTPANGVHQGIKMAEADTKGFTQQELKKGWNKQHTLTTNKDAKLTGTLILADGKNTFLLVDKTVYKVENRTGRVLRETLLTSKPGLPQ